MADQFIWRKPTIVPAFAWALPDAGG